MNSKSPMVALLMWWMSGGWDSEMLGGGGVH